MLTNEGGGGFTGNKYFSRRDAADIKWPDPFPWQITTYFKNILKYNLKLKFSYTFQLLFHSVRNVFTP